MEATREGKSRCWDIWIVHLRSFLASWEAFYERVGRYVSRNPGKVILLTILFVILCGIGFWRLETEHRTLKLFVPTRSTSEKALKKGKPYFQNMMNSREEEMLLIPKNGNNVLTTACINDAIYISDKLTKIAGFRDLCLPKPQFVRQSRQYSPKENCSFANPFEILKYQVTDMYDMSYRLYNSKSKTSTLMSNGRAPVFNFGYNFAGLNFNRSSKKIIATAKAVRLLYYLKESENEEITKANLKWEKEFISAMKESEKELNCSNLYFAAARSMDDAVFESSTRDIPLISATFGIMIAFTCMVMSKFTNPIRGHSWLAVAGIFSTSLGILAGFGLTIACGVPFISLVGVLPFLVFSIGIDDMFIIVDELDRQPTSYSSENRVAYSLSKIGATITMTTVTDVLAFGISFTSSFPGIRYFCIYASLVITIEFLIQITFFMAFVSIDAKRIKANRTDCCPAFTGPDKNLCKIPDGYSFSTTIMETYAKFILKRPMKVVIMCMALLLLGFGIYGCMHVNNEFNRTTLALKGTYYSKYVTAFEKNFPQTIPVSLQIVQPIDYSHPNVQEQLLKMPSLATQTGHYGSMNVSWFHYFKDFVTKYKIKTNGTNFKKAVNIFLRLPPFRQHNLDVIRDDRKNIIASRILVFTKSSSSATFQKESMVKLREELQLKTDLPLDAISDPFIFFEQYAAVTKEVIRNLIGVAVTIVFVITPFCVHPVIVLFILLGFISLIVELFGIMYIFNISLNAISMINLVMAIGFSVDYSAHIAHAFISSTKTIVHDRVIDALCTVGVSVLLGGISTFLGMLVTGFSDSEIFQIFFRMFLGIVVFGLFNGMVVLPVLLSLFGRFTIEEKSAPDLKYRYYFSLGWNGFKSFLRLLNLLPSRDGNESARQTISVVGISARVPTAKEKEQFWSMLESGKDTISDYPKDREARYKYFEHSYNPNRPISGRNYVTRGSYMEDIDLFDYKFFGISNSEARSMDPQQRMLLQGAFEAIEDAGMKLEDLQRRRTGVYVGIMNLDYSSVVLRDDMMLTIDQFASTGTAFSIAANRLSFALNLMGPSVAIDTACSSSLTALSVACDHLREGRCDVAIVSAANLILCSKKQMTICRANMLAPDGRCKVFDERADGYGRGEAALTVILKRNDVAIYSEDDIYADLVSWGCNNDGQTAAPMTAPSEIGQKTLLHDVLLRANVNPLDVQYVETHGTGTIIGDMVETKTVGEVYGKSRKPDEPLRIGSVKSNINHTESAAGLAGLIKVSLMMKHKKLVPTVNIENHSARLGISDKGMMVQEVTEDWPEHPKGLPRLAAVNSFGYGGSNAHVVVKQPEVQRNNYTNNSSATLEERMRVLVLSARSQSALTCIANKFGGWLKGFDDTTQNQVNICYSLSERRTEHSYRLAVGFTSLQVAAKVLEEIQDSQESAHKAVCFGQINTSVSKIGLLFGGQGSQWKGMAGNLIQDKFILHQLHKVEYLAKKCGHETSIVEYLTVPDSDNVNESEDLITVQLSIFALEYAVGEFLKQKAGLSPKAVGGHSLGDITAACVSGSITLKEAVKIILARAGLQNRCNEKGAMAAIGK